MTDQRVTSGIAGLDEVLHGGLLERRSYLVSGPPGSGKTTIGWHFVTAIAPGERSLVVTFGEGETELRRNAEALGFDVGATAILDLSPSVALFEEAKTYDIFSASEVEREPTTRRIVEQVETVRPVRVFVDSMSSLRYLSSDYHEFRRQVQSFVRYLVERGAVVLMSSELSPAQPDDDLRFVADGVIEVGFGPRARTLAVVKFRGSDYSGGVHTLKLGGRGATVFPRLIPGDHKASFESGVLSSGLDALDALLHGGLERGTITMVTGPTGVGKTTVGMRFVEAAARHGVRSAVYTFDERAETLIRRSESIALPVRAMIEAGALGVTELEALRFGPDEFAKIVRDDVERRDTRIVMIDSVSGYRLAVAGDDLVERLHALCRYLQYIGVTVLLINELQDVLTFRVSEAGISYLADNVLFLRYLERVVRGRSEIVRGIGVLKKRLSGFDNTVREFRITNDGIVVGAPLVGILTPMMGRDDVIDSD